MSPEPVYNPINRYCRFGRKTEAPVEDEDYKKIFDFEESEELLNELNGFKDLSPELAKNMRRELAQVMENPENVLIVGTDGDKTITIVTAPEEVVGGHGPVLIPTLDKNRILSMVSSEFITEMAENCRDMEDQDGAQDFWSLLLENFFEKTLELSERGGGALLEIPDFIPEEGF
jgi:hypothetical protein